MLILAERVLLALTVGGWAAVVGLAVIGAPDRDVVVAGGALFVVCAAAVGLVLRRMIRAGDFSPPA